MLIAQITDCHILPPERLLFGQIDTAQRLQAVVRRLNGLPVRPDVVLCTGDLTDRGEPAAYRHLRQLLAPLGMPVYLVPGNHDDRDALRAAFADHTYLPGGGTLNYVIEAFPVRLIGLDTLVPGQAHGELDHRQLGWLDSILAARPDVPTMLFMHHPPFMTGIEAFDIMSCMGTDRLAAAIAEHPQVEAIFCGHHHRAMVTRWRGVQASIGPSTAHQLVLDGGEATIGWSLEPAQAALHTWRRGSGLITSTVSAESFPGQFSYGRWPTRDVA